MSVIVRMLLFLGCWTFVEGSTTKTAAKKFDPANELLRKKNLEEQASLWKKQHDQLLQQKSELTQQLFSASAKKTALQLHTVNNELQSVKSVLGHYEDFSKELNNRLRDRAASLYVVAHTPEVTAGDLRAKVVLDEYAAIAFNTDIAGAKKAFESLNNIYQALGSQHPLAKDIDHALDSIQKMVFFYLVHDDVEAILVAQTFQQQKQLLKKITQNVQVFFSNADHLKYSIQHLQDFFAQEAVSLQDAFPDLSSFKAVLNYLYLDYMQKKATDHFRRFGVLEEEYPLDAVYFLETPAPGNDPLLVQQQFYIYSLMHEFDTKFYSGKQPSTTAQKKYRDLLELKLRQISYLLSQKKSEQSVALLADYITKATIIDVVLADQATFKKNIAVVLDQIKPDKDLKKLLKQIEDLHYAQSVLADPLTLGYMDKDVLKKNQAVMLIKPKVVTEATLLVAQKIGAFEVLAQKKGDLGSLVAMFKKMYDPAYLQSHFFVESAEFFSTEILEAFAHQLTAIAAGKKGDERNKQLAMLHEFLGALDALQHDYGKYLPVTTLRDHVKNLKTTIEKAP